jgi:(S)-2-hydroxy-acid oxidase
VLTAKVEIHQDRPNSASDIEGIPRSAVLVGVAKPRMNELLNSHASHDPRCHEVATSRAAAKAGIPMGVSHWATKSMEGIAAAGKGYGNPYALQISAANSRQKIAALLKRAEKHGYKALLMTVDAPIMGRRLSELRNGIDLPPGLNFPNILEDDGTSPTSFQNTIHDASTVSKYELQSREHNVLK